MVQFIEFVQWHILSTARCCIRLLLVILVTKATVSGTSENVPCVDIYTDSRLPRLVVLVHYSTLTIVLSWALLSTDALETATK